MSVYCNNENCEYNEDGCCEYEGSLVIDEGGCCARFRHKLEVANENPAEWPRTWDADELIRG